MDPSVLFEALTLTLRPEVLMFLGAGVAVGFVVGVLPGMGGVVGMTILLPFVLSADPVAGLGLLIGMSAINATSDTFTSVLFGVPGGGGAQATVMDGYPLARLGQASRALYAAFLASGIGGIISAFILLGTIPIARPLVLAFGAPELFALTILGLSMVGILSRGAPLKGLIVALLGMVLSTVGLAATTGDVRFAFDTLYMWDGLSLIIIALGIYGVPEVFSLLVEGKSISRVDNAQRRPNQFSQAFRDVRGNLGLVTRSSAVGATIGILPGIGGSVIDWITYGWAAQTRKNNRFGRGDIRGVIAPEAANNAKEGGVLVPTMLFGVPGSGTTAILLAALSTMGLLAGPSMAEPRNLPILLSLVWMLVIANLVGVALCMIATPHVSRVTSVNPKVLAPLLMVVLMVAAFQAHQHWADVISLLVVGALGTLLKVIGWPRIPILIGFILGANSERYLWLSITRFELSWLVRPSVLAIFAVTALTIFAGIMALRRSSVSETQHPGPGEL